ncbi:MAG: hypothetical protein QNK37_04400 [Acidobacteriota bacterium]|nr:hypothetical protein [Acidobacteriota bacterium]
MRVCLAILVICSCLPVPASEHRFGNILIADERSPSAEANHGYIGYYFTLTNLSTEKTHKVDLYFTDPYSSRWQAVNEIRRSVTLQPGATSRIHLPVWSWVPAPVTYGVDIDGVPSPQTASLAIRSTPMLFREKRHAVLTTRSLDLVKAYRSIYTKGMGVELRETTAQIEAWGSNWLDYSSFELTALSRAEWDRLSPDGRNALQMYARNGGGLLIYENNENLPLEGLTKARRVNQVTVHGLGFGMVFSFDGGVFDLDEETRKFLVGSLMTWPPYPGKNAPGLSEMIPVVEELRTPVRGFFGLLIVFALLMGPLNLLVLARRGKRIWLLWTVPAISLVATLTVVVFAVFSEGTATRQRLESITLLDEQNHMATTLGLGGIYSPLTRDSGLHFPKDADVHPDFQYIESGFLSVDWSRDQNLAAGWVRSRLPFYYKVRHTESRRERLVVTGSGENLEVVNGLGADIEMLYVAGEDGRLYAAESIAAGARAKLGGLSLPVTGEPESIRSLYLSDWSLANLDLYRPSVNMAASLLQPGQYLAVLQESPFFGGHLESVNELTAWSVVIGTREVKP